MRRTVRSTGFVLATAITMLVSCRGDQSTRPIDPGGSVRQIAWATPSHSPFTRSLPTHPSLELRPMEEARGISPLRSLSAASAPGDSTNEVCRDTEWCGIQGDIVGGLVGVQCVSGPGTCGNAAYSWSIRNPPPNSTTTFTPNPQDVDQALEMLIQTTDSTPPGLYQSTLVITPVGSSPPSDPDTIPITVHVVCNYRLQSCPEIEIVDLTKGADVVVSAPQPRQDTYIGRPMRLRMRQKAGTGGARAYTMVAGAWTLYGGQQTTVKSYDISTGTLTPLTEPEDINTMSWYYVVSNNDGEYPILAEATLSSTDGADFGPRATASYRPAGPTGISLTSRTTPEGPTVGPYFTIDDVALSFGRELGGTPVAGINAAAGISWSFFATLPAGDNGYMSATQIVNTVTTFTVRPGATPVPDPPITTNGAYWLDGCSLYSDPVRGGGAPVPVSWLDNDSPYFILTSQYAAVSRTDNFRIFLMYRPSGPESIWIPLGNLAWNWGASTQWTADPGLFRQGWQAPANPVWTPNPTGAVSSEFPTWSGVVPFRGGQCTTLPTQ